MHFTTISSHFEVCSTHSTRYPFVFLFCAKPSRVSCRLSDCIYMYDELNNKLLKVVVVGGGVASLTAGQSLIHYGLKPVVLEGRNRVGGRALTISSHTSNSQEFQDLLYNGCVLTNRDYNVETRASSMHDCNILEQLV